MRAKASPLKLVLLISALLWATALTATRSDARPVSASTASLTAEHQIRQHLRAYGHWNGSVTASIVAVTETRVEGDLVFYVVQVEPSGYLLAASDDEFVPILFYSTGGIFDAARIQLRDTVEAWLAQETRGVHRKLRALRESLGQARVDELRRRSKVGRAWATSGPPRRFEELEEPGSGPSVNDSNVAFGAGFLQEDDEPVVVGPLLSTTWDQDHPYNLYTPGLPTCTNTATGCVATATAQLMRYWRWPKVGKGENSYFWWTGFLQGQWLSASFNHSYEWANMPNMLDSGTALAQKQAVARLMSDVGVSVEMNYGCTHSGGSRASTQTAAQDALPDHFRYTRARRVDRSGLTADQFFAAIRAELDAPNPKPMLIRFDGVVGGHSAVVDGYRIDDTNWVSINYGWGWGADFYNITNNWTEGYDGNGQPIEWNVSSMTIFPGNVPEGLFIEEPNLVQGDRSEIGIEIRAGEDGSYWVTVADDSLVLLPPAWSWDSTASIPVTLQRGQSRRVVLWVRPDSAQATLKFRLYRELGLGWGLIVDDSSVILQAAERDRSGPTVVTHRAGAHPSTNVTVVFSEDLNTNTVNSSTISVVGALSGAHSSSFSFDHERYELTINPATDFTPGEAVTVSIGTGITDIAGNHLANEYRFAFQVQADPPPAPTALSLSATVTPSTSVPPHSSVTLSGVLTYNTGTAVASGTISIDTGDNVFTASVANGTFSRAIVAPSSSRTISVTAREGAFGLTTSTGVPITIQGGSGGSGYTFYRSTTARNVQNTDPYDPILETQFFRRSDSQVYVWLHFTNLYRPVRARWVWTRPDGQHYSTYESGWTDNPADFGFEYWYWWKLWSNIAVSNNLASYHPGRWTCKVYVDSGSGWTYRTTEEFTIGFEFTEHRMAKGVQSLSPHDPVTPTNVFNQADAQALTWANADNVVEAFDVRWDFYEPSGALYDSYSWRTEDPGQDRYFGWYRFWGWTLINAHSAAGKAGDWRVEVLVRDPGGAYQRIYTDRFQIVESPNVAPTLAVIATPGLPSEGQTVVLNASASDNTYLKRVVLYWNDGTLRSQSWDPIIAAQWSQAVWVGPFAAGQNVEYWMEAWDTSGNHAVTQHAAFVVQPEHIAPPSVPVGPQHLSPSQPGTYTASGATSSLGHPLEYQFVWGDGTESAWITGGVVHSWFTEGNYAVRTRARCQNHPTRVSELSPALNIAVMAPRGSLQFDASVYWGSETDRQAVVTVTRTGGGSGAISGVLSTTGGTATPGADYMPISQTVVFADGDTAPKTLVLPIEEDSLGEPSEVVGLRLSHPDGGGSIGTPAQAILVITDNDPSRYAAAWGWNLQGQLGNGTNGSANIPGNVIGVGDDDFSAYRSAAGWGHSLFIRNGGTVWSVGYNEHGELGNGSNISTNRPVQVPGLTGVVAVAGGGRHSLALRFDGTVWVWGDNSQGQLGTGVPTNVPAQVTSLSNIVAIAAGAFDSLALQADGTVWRWGWIIGGGFGAPQAMSTLADVVAIGAGETHAVALTRVGSVWTWGWNDRGQLGNGTDSGSDSPVQVVGLGSVVAIAVGGSHSLALLSDGSVRTWGANGSGQLGDNTTENRTIPVPPVGLPGAKEIAAGSNHSLVIGLNQSLHAWGWNLHGQIGDGSNVNRTSPVRVLSKVEHVSANLHTIALGVPPGLFSMTSPLSQSAVAAPTSATLVWTASQDATSYEYCVEQVGTLACHDPYRWVSVGNATSLGLTGLLPDTSYNWTVRARSVFGTSYSTSGYWTFRTAPPPPAGTLQFSAATYAVGENAGLGVVTVTRTGGSFGALTVTVATSDGTATAGSDYTAVSQVVTFADGDTAPKPVSIPILDDMVYEENEIVIVTLTVPSGGSGLGAPSRAELMIVDDDGVSCTNVEALVPASGLMGWPVRFAALGTPLGCHGDVSAVWSFGTGHTDSPQPETEHIYGTAGRQTWTLNATLGTSALPPRTGAIDILSEVCVASWSVAAPAIPEESDDPVAALWRNSDLCVEAGQVVTVYVSDTQARWSSAGQTWTAEGDVSRMLASNAGPLPGAPVMALVGRIGITELPRLIGHWRRWTATRSGCLWLAPNEAWDQVWDNTGQLPVTACVAAPEKPTPVPCTGVEVTVPDSALVDGPAPFRAEPTPLGCVGDLAVEWDFGDGSPLILQPIEQHRYQAEGQHQWILNWALGGSTGPPQRGLIGVLGTSCRAVPVAAAVALPEEVQNPVSLMWQDSGVDVAAGQTVGVSVADGATWRSGGIPWTAAGDPGELLSGDGPLPGAPVMALVGRIGPSGVPFVIGAGAQWAATWGGRLYLAPNDYWHRLADNTGTLSVSVCQTWRP